VGGQEHRRRDPKGRRIPITRGTQTVARGEDRRLGERWSSPYLIMYTLLFKGFYIRMSGRRFDN
jgi:hypothetical protein